MATRHTSNYQLNLWEPNDAFVRTEFNENSSKIDAAIAAHESALAQLPGMNNTLVSHTASLNTHAAAIEARLRCVSGSYTGNGANSRTVDFGVMPKVVLLVMNDNSEGVFSVLIHGQSKAGLSDGTNANYGASLSWSGTTVTFTAVNTSYGNSLNTSGRSYLYFAFY